MGINWIFELWTNGDFDETLDLDIDPNSTSMVETYLTKKDGEDYSHAYIAESCSQSGDEVLCGVHDEGDAPSIEFLSQGTIRVTVGLRTTGGSHRSAGAVFSL